MATVRYVKTLLISLVILSDQTKLDNLRSRPARLKTAENQIQLGTNRERLDLISLQKNYLEL